jgi:hypothetical protein
MKGLSIRVLPSQVQAANVRALGAKPKVMDLTEAIAAIKAGTLDAQENPFSNTVTYGVTSTIASTPRTNHFYVSRPIFVHRPSFDAWPRQLQTSSARRFAMRSHSSAICTSRRKRRGRRDQEGKRRDRRADDGRAQAFVAAVSPIYGEPASNSAASCAGSGPTLEAPVGKAGHYGRHAGNDLPRVSSVNGSEHQPEYEATAVTATGTPRLPYDRMPAPTRNTMATPTKRPTELMNAIALARQSVGYCSGSHNGVQREVGAAEPEQEDAPVEQ